MSIEIARYQFFSWARKGISANITEVDDLGIGGSTLAERAEIPVSVKLNGNAISKHISLIGPGDIIGINKEMIIRTYPLHWVTDTEPNYLAFVEFYDEDFCWRYTPAVPQGERLRPWIFLLVLKETEFARTERKIPLPAIKIKSAEAYPPNNETWLWAHVHSHVDIPDSELSLNELFLLSLNKTVNDDPDQIYSCLMSPRKLEPNTAYYAFVIPAFETGRMAGLEQPTEGIIAQTPSWDSDRAKNELEMPVYYEWYFRTGANTDFESLVKLLERRWMDPMVGIRDMDCSKPGFMKADGSGPIPGTIPSNIGLEGALKSPLTKSTDYPDSSAENNFQVELQKIVNLPVTMSANPDNDPIVSIPLYGKNHAKKSANDVVQLKSTEGFWVNDLNNDPRTRVAAGFGTLVVQKNQDNIMKKAWGQVTKIIEANRRIKATKFMMSVAFQYTQKTFSKLQNAVLLGVCYSVLKKVKGSPDTIYHMLNESRLPAVVFSGTFRRIIRPNGAIAIKLKSVKKFNYTELVKNVNDGKITASPLKETPAGLFTTQYIANTIFPYRLPAWLMWHLKHDRIILLILLLVFILLAVITGNLVLFGILAAAIIASYRQINRLSKNANASEALLDNRKQLKSIKSIPPRPNFTLHLSDEKNIHPPTVTAPGQDSVEAKNFRAALIDLNKRLAEKAPEKAIVKFDLDNAFNNVSRAIHPYIAFPLRLKSIVKFPKYIDLSKPEKIFPAMAYPDIEDPMYKKLSDISSELLLPNLQLVQPNTISLLETNQKFIESYMVGLNHEMGRELLWREYPTDQRGSYFRQFWDVKGIIRPAEGNSETAELTEEYKDIKPIDQWETKSSLGSHNNRNLKGRNEDDVKRLVLVVRGDLFKRYPNVIIFAQKAIAADNPADESEIGLELTEDEFKKQVKFPLFKAEIAPDIKFFGFDLTIDQAKGTEKTTGFNDDLGWFFILQEIPGEPRFGMDIRFDQVSDGLSWDDLAWTNLPDDLKFIGLNASPPNNQRENVLWGADSSSMAYILFQNPVMVAVHAKEMLDKL